MMARTQSLSSPFGLRASARDRIVAVVGRAGYLAESGLGMEIDSAEFVVRVNWTLPVDPVKAPHVGSRTDLLYTMQNDEANEWHRKAARCGVAAVRLNARLRRELANRVDQYRYIPNTGTVAVFDALEKGAAEVRVYGFDLHTSARYADTGGTHGNRAKYAGQREARMSIRTHNPDADRDLLRGLLADERFKPDAVLRAVLA